MVQWLGLCASITGSKVQALVGELKSCMPHGMAKKIKVSCPRPKDTDLVQNKNMYTNNHKGQQVT